jgi:hypothetical protein
MQRHTKDQWFVPLGVQLKGKIMLFKIDGQIIQTGRSWIDANGTTHPSNWEIWTPEYKASMGITEFIPESQPDSRFYTWSQNEDLSYNQIEKLLADITREDGTTEDGLKTVWIKKSKDTANILLRITDWQVIAKVERDRTIDEAVATYRAEVLTACETIEGKINACNNLEEFKLLFDIPTDSDGNAIGNSPIDTWPSDYL